MLAPNRVFLAFSMIKNWGTTRVGIGKRACRYNLISRRIGTTKPVTATNNICLAKILSKHVHDLWIR